MKSGIEMLEELKESLDLLNKRYEVIEQNMKEILDRMNGFRVRQEAQAKPMIASTVPQPDIQAATIQTEKATAAGTTKVMGKIKHENRAVIGVSVKILDNQGQTVKETKTNRAGDWMCFLPAGRYKAEYKLEGILNASVNFKVTPGQKLLRVAQPKPQE